VIGATNFPELLDKALVRPGRFDRHIHVPLPDVRGREQILRLHTKKVPLAADVDLNVVARGTPGFSGAGPARERRPRSWSRRVADAHAVFKLGDHQQARS